MNIIVLIDDLFDVFVVLLQRAFKITSPFTDASRQRDFLLYTSLPIKSPTSNVSFAAVQCSSKLWTASIFPSFDTLLQFVQTGVVLLLFNIIY